ncbi:MAG: FtsW/RodA/SpoVE family cell cycle protein [Chloroflexota bacterium]
MRTNFLRNYDYLLLIITAVLVVFGILMIASATNGAVDAELISRVPNQIRYAVIGIVLMFVLTAVDYRLLGALHFWLYLLLVGMLVMVLFFGQEGDGGARRWINVGILIQPSEIGKIIIVITLGYFLSRRYDQMDRLSTVLASLVHIAIPIVPIFIQPDLGTTIVFLVLWGTLVWAAGLRFRHIAMLMLIGLISTPFMWSVMESYQRERFTTFIAVSQNTGEDDLETRTGTEYNYRQAAISIGSGGLLGKGYMNGTQSQLRFLRVRHTDFIFSVIAEEFGFIGGLVVMSAIGLVIMRILRGARLAQDPLGSMICYGVASMIFFQTTVSIGMNLGLLPVTGLTLPFISSGGTSLLATLAGIGLAQSVIVRRRRVA